MRLNIVVFLTFILLNMLVYVSLSVARQNQNIAPFNTSTPLKGGMIGISSVATPTLSRMPYAGGGNGSILRQGTIGISTPTEVLKLAPITKNNRNKPSMNNAMSTLLSASLPSESLPKEDLSIATKVEPRVKPKVEPRAKPSNTASSSIDIKMPSLPSASKSKSADLILKPKPISAALIVSKTWKLNPGPLRPQLMTWSELSGYQLVWKASNDFSMETASSFHGKFLEAMEKLFSGLQQSGGHALRVTVYEANKVITISEN